MNLEKSLQAMKNDIAKKEETLKALQKTYPQVSHLPEAQILAYFDVDTIHDLKKYIKESTQPHDNLTERNIDICSCTNSQGQPKDIYTSEESAKREANALATQKRVQLSVYPCPDACGWHLSKR